MVGNIFKALLLSKWPTYLIACLVKFYRHRKNNFKIHVELEKSTHNVNNLEKQEQR